MEIGSSGRAGASHRGLTAAYLGALGLIGVLSLFAYQLVGRAVDAHYLDGPRINQAGRQRMLSQRIVADLLLRTGEPSGDHAAAAEAQLSVLFATWSRVHAALADGDPGLGLPPHEGGATRELYRAVDLHYRRMAEPIRAILAPGAAAGREPEALVRAVAEAAPGYLAAMEALVGAFEAEASRRVGRLRAAGGWLLAAILALLAAEAWWIFRPLVGRVRASMAELEGRNAELEEALRSVRTLRGLLPICSS
ncbi:MAG: type IV pili methyl-accepting chemotaxis transducer N-terminal domain-containing protein, partial [Deferrisomatales bacterium]